MRQIDLGMLAPLLTGLGRQQQERGNFEVEIDLQADRESKTLSSCDMESIVFYTDGSKRKTDRQGRQSLSRTMTQLLRYHASGTRGISG